MTTNSLDICLEHLWHCLAYICARSLAYALLLFCFCIFLPYFVSSSAKFNYKLVVILLEMLMKAKNIDEHIKKYTCL